MRYKENAPGDYGTLRRLDEWPVAAIIYGPNPKEKSRSVDEWIEALSSRTDRANCPLALKGTVRRGDPSSHHPVRERGIIMFMKFVGYAGLLLCSYVHAGTVPLTCTPPVANVDGSALKTPLTFKFYLSAAVSPAQPNCAYTWPNLNPGTYSFTATAVDSTGAESARSLPATKIVTAAPQTPTITLTSLAGPVFSAQVTRNSLVWPQVGTVVAGRPCDPTQAISFQGTTYWRIDVANVTALPGLDLSQTPAFGQCQ